MITQKAAIKDHLSYQEISVTAKMIFIRCEEILSCF